DDSMALYREPARIGGYRAKYSTLMMTRHGELLGTLATCYREPHRPTERETRLVELFARQAADLVEIARLKRALQEADRRRDAAVAALAHEIRNPLQSILNAAQSLHLASAAGSANSELCDLVTRQARLLARLADELIEAARVGAGKTALKKEAVDLSGAM